MEPLPDLMRPNLGGVHESRFKLDRESKDIIKSFSVISRAYFLGSIGSYNLKLLSN